MLATLVKTLYKWSFCSRRRCCCLTVTWSKITSRRKWIMTSIGQSKHMRVTHFNPYEFLVQPQPVKKSTKSTKNKNQISLICSPRQDYCKAIWENWKLSVLGILMRAKESRWQSVARWTPTFHLRLSHWLILKTSLAKSVDYLRVRRCMFCYPGPLRRVASFVNRLRGSE